MSGSATIGTEQGILQHTLGITAMAFPVQVYVALCAASLPPSETIGGVEAFGGGYSRVAATFALLASPTNIAANSQSVEFPLASAAWGSLGFFEIWSAQTGGSRLYWGGLVDPVSGAPTTLNVAAGDIVRFSAGTLTIQAVPFTPTVSAGVSSFNTRTGAVILSNSDVVGVLPPSANPPLMDGTAAVGTSAAWARGDHVHPSDAGIAANAAAAGHNIGRNLLHNPLFNVAQRGQGPFTSGYSLDRWRIDTTGDTSTAAQSGMSDAQRAQVGDEAAQQCLLVTVNGTAGAGNFTQAWQGIESVRRLAGKTVTVSFWASSASLLNLGVRISQNFGVSGGPSPPVTTATQSVTLAANFMRYTMTFAIPSASGKTFGTTVGSDYTLLLFGFSSGATNAALIGTGVQSGVVGIWGVQLEIGSVATPLEKPDPRYDLANCQRFYQTGLFLLYAYQLAGSPVQTTAYLSTTMRASPTFTAGSDSSSNVGARSLTAFSPSAGTCTATATATNPVVLNVQFSASADL